MVLGLGVLALVPGVVRKEWFFPGVDGEVGGLSGDAYFENVRPLVLGDEIREGEEIARVSRHAGPFDGVNFDGGVGVGFFEVRSLPPEWAGDHIGFAVGIDITDGCSFGDVFVEKLDFFKRDRSGWSFVCLTDPRVG